MNDASKAIKDAINKLKRAEEEFRILGQTRAAEIMAAEVMRIEVVSETLLKDLAGVELGPAHHKHRLMPVFFKLWRERFPKYGEPSSVDRAEVVRLFREYIEPVHGQKNELWLERIFENYVRSTASWVVDYRTIHTFAKNFRLFADKPLIDADGEAQPIARPDNFGSRLTYGSKA